jgi:hypothetical protein
MNSVDPVERWKAKERAFNRSMMEASAGLVEQAKKNAKIRQQIEQDDTHITTY